MTGYDPYRLTSALQNPMPFIFNQTWASWPIGSEHEVVLTDLTLHASLRTFKEC